MPKTIGLDRTTAKWIQRAAVATSDYEKGIASPKRPWAASASAASGTFHKAVSSPDVKTLYERGIARAGDERWATMSAKKGVGRFAEGVEAGRPYYQSQMSDVLAQIEQVRDRPRGPRGSAENYAKVKDIGDKLHAWRLAKRATAGA